MKPSYSRNHSQSKQKRRSISWTEKILSLSVEILITTRHYIRLSDQSALANVYNIFINTLDCKADVNEAGRLTFSQLPIGKGVCTREDRHNVAYIVPFTATQAAEGRACEQIRPPWPHCMSWRHAATASCSAPFTMEQAWDLKQLQWDPHTGRSRTRKPF